MFYNVFENLHEINNPTLFRYQTRYNTIFVQKIYAVHEESSAQYE